MSQFDAIRFQPSRPLLREVTADRLNTILSEIRRNRPKGERGITVRQTGDGTYIGLAANLGRGGGAVERHPFRLVPSGEASFKVDPGTINGIIAENWSAAFNATSSLRYVVVQASCSANKIVSTQLQVVSAAPSEPMPLAWSVPSNFQALIGMVQIIDENMQLFQIANTNLQYAVVKRITVSIGSSSLPYTNYYTWQPV